MHRLKYLRTHFTILIFVAAFISPVSAETPVVNQSNIDHQLLTETIHVLGGVNNRVPRWSSDVRMALVGTLSTTVKHNLDALLTQLSLYSGLEFRWIKHKYSATTDYIDAVSKSPQHDLTLCSRDDSDDCANFVVILSEQTNMHQITLSLPMRPVYQKATAANENVHCFFSPGISRKFDIQRSVVYINSNLSEKMQNTCLQEEITQSLGLFNDYTGSHYYSFNNVVSPKQLTAHDKMLLSSLYDRAYSPGTWAALIAQQVIEYSARSNNITSARAE